MTPLMLDESIDENASPITKIFWEEHLKKTRQKIKDLRVSWPEVKLSSNAKLAGMVLATALGASFIAAGEKTPDRLMEPFRFTAPVVPEPPAQVMAWVTPPKGIPSAKPQSLPEGSVHPVSPQEQNGTADTPFISVPPVDAAIDISGVHQQSTLHISVIGAKAEITMNGQGLTPVEEIIGNDTKITYIYAAPLIEENTVVTFSGGPVWNISVTQDRAPEIIITGAAQKEDGTLEMRCIAEDDFGIIQGDIMFTVPGAHPDAEPPEQAVIGHIPLNGSSLCME